MSAELVKRAPGTIRLLANLEKSGAITSTSLDLPEGLSFDRYEALGAFLGALHRASQWYLGDWIIYGEATYGEKYAQAMEATGLNKDTLRHYVWVCSRVAPSRRIEGLHFTMHAKVAALTPKEQKRWLNLARREGLSSRDLDHRIQEEQALLGAQQGGLADGGGSSSPGAALPDRAGHSTSPASGLPVSYVVPGPVVRRLVGEAVSGRDGYVRVPGELIERLASVMQD